MSYHYATTHLRGTILSKSWNTLAFLMPKVREKLLLSSKRPRVWLRVFLFQAPHRPTSSLRASPRHQPQCTRPAAACQLRGLSDKSTRTSKSFVCKSCNVFLNTDQFAFPLSRISCASASFVRRIVRVLRIDPAGDVTETLRANTSPRVML